MISFFVILFTSYTQYFLKDVFTKNPFRHVSFLVISLTNVMWLFLLLEFKQHPYIQSLLFLTSTGFAFGLFLLHYPYFILIQPLFRYLILIFNMCIVLLSIGFCLAFFLFNNTIFVTFEFVMIFGIFYFIQVFYVINKYPTRQVLLSFSIKIPFLVPLIFLTILIILTYFFASYSMIHFVRLSIYYLLYSLFLVPYFRCFYSQMKLIIIKSFIYSAGVILLVCLYQYLLFFFENNLTHDDFMFSKVLLFVLMIPLFHQFIGKVSNYIDNYLFALLYDKELVNELIEELSIVQSKDELKAVLKRNRLNNDFFQLIYVWKFRSSSAWELIGDDDIVLTESVVSFLRHREVIVYFELVNEYKNLPITPYKAELKVVIEFMKQYSIYRLGLLQRSNEMYGAIAISHSDSFYFDYILDEDVTRIVDIEHAITTAICNINSFDYLYEHQQKLEVINNGISLFNMAIDDSTYNNIVSNVLTNLISELNNCYLLIFDNNIYYSSRRFIIDGDNDDMADISFHSHDIHQWFGNNMRIKFSLLYDQDIPKLIKKMLIKFKAKECILLRLNELENSSIMVLFLNSNTDILDYRISFVQMFLRQSEIFYQYQKYGDELNHLQNYLKRLMDALPIGILISTNDFKLFYVNSKMEDQMAYNLSDYFGFDIFDLPIQTEILKSILDVKEFGTDYFDQIHFPIMNRTESCSLNSFKVTIDSKDWFVSVLTSIQQSKELFEQMNQSNRLAMMSKIAVGISYELTKPVQKLVDAVTQIKTQWSDLEFQKLFNTDVIPQVDRINLLCQSLLRLSRSSSESLVEVSLSNLLEQVLRLITGDIRNSKQVLQVMNISKETIMIDQVMCIQILMNLLLCCFKSLSNDQSKVTLDLFVKDNAMLVFDIKVKDFENAEFLDHSDLSDLLELSIVHQIVSNQGGEFKVWKKSNWVFLFVSLPIQHVLDSSDSN